MGSRLKLVAGALLLAASFALAVFSLQPSRETPEQGVVKASVTAEVPPANMTRRLVAARRIGRGERIGPQMVRTLQIEGVGSHGTLSKPGDAIGAVALEEIREGQFILATALTKDPDARPGLSVLVPAGYRAVALRVNDEVAVGNFLRADDLVDIQLVLPSDQVARLRGIPVSEGAPPESRVLLEKVRVLSAGEALTVDESGKAIRMQNITVAVTPEQALHIAVAKQVGTFYLSLRNPLDTGRSDVGSVTARRLIGAAPAEAEPPAAKPAPPAKRTGRRIQMILGDETTYRPVPEAP